MIDDVKGWDLYHQKNYQEEVVHSQYAEKVESQFPRGSLILELGCGTGADAIFFLQKGHRVIALDISEFALKVLKERAESAGFSQKLALRQADFSLHLLPVKDSSVDIVYSRISLNYFGSDETAEIFKDIYRVLKPGGKAFLTLKSPDDQAEMTYLEENATLYEPNVYIEGGIIRSRFTVAQLKQILASAGIEGSVSPFQESLTKRGGGYQPILYVNEVTFVKK